ncbi:SAM-dependent methyltransferase [Thermogymnomonas acidicola]|uniref:SAM-dependent methyltransferase n=1 Tax=Thermogymnomonas acidicola TaxID=399579 RepID=A0AA37F8W2_9ARCH|nr:methyltransferase domain-containing protein [Thermogymnomonas acidicola]GGM67144.1 SAM-dependent methyltransferase [Thermogymnomonas acidicola]
MEGQHKFDYARISEMRSRYVPDAAVLSAVLPGPSDTIIDVGSGDGYYSILFSRFASKVYAVERDRDAARYIEDRVKGGGVKNVDVWNTDICEVFPEVQFNKVFFSNSFHDLRCREGLIDVLLNRSRPGLQVTFVEFKKVESIGPPLEVRIADNELATLMTGRGFRLVRKAYLEIHYIHTYELQGHGDNKKTL